LTQKLTINSEDEFLAKGDFFSGFEPSPLSSHCLAHSAYGEQLRLYRRAAELIFEKPVTESVVYMTGAGVTVEII